MLNITFDSSELEADSPIDVVLAVNVISFASAVGVELFRVTEIVSVELFPALFLIL